MICPYGCKFDAIVCMMRHNSAIKRMENPELYDGDERIDYDIVPRIKTNYNGTKEILL